MYHNCLNIRLIFNKINKIKNNCWNHKFINILNFMLIKGNFHFKTSTKNVCCIV